MKEQLIAELEREISPERSEAWAHFFGIAPGRYGENDILLGIKTPVNREISLRYRDLPEPELLEMLHSPVHEFRFSALCILSERYKKQPEHSLKIFLNNTKYVNNWDLVDGFAWKIVGMHCLTSRDESLLHGFAKSKNLWERRIAVVSYIAFYRRGVLGDGPDIIIELLDDPEPLIQKACGWMLREIYRTVDKHFVESFIIDHYTQLSRTTLRAAIERMPEEQRQQYLKGAF